MKRLSFLLLLLALTLCACRAQELPAPLPDAPAASPSDQASIPLTPDPTPDAPAEPTVDTPEDGVHLQDGTAYDDQNGAPVTGSGLTELDGAWYVFQPDGILFPFVHGLNDCNGILYYHTGEDGFALEDVLTEGEMEEKILERIALREAIAQLTDREQMVIRLRYFHGLTQDKTAKILGVSQVQISRIEKKALAALRQHI